MFIKKINRMVWVALSVTVFATGASAVTVSPVIDFTSAVPKEGGTYNFGGVFTYDLAGDITLAVEAYNYSENNSAYTLSANKIGITKRPNGLGACTEGDASGCGQEPNLNSIHGQGTNQYEKPELLKFTFTQTSTGNPFDVLLSSLKFNLNDNVDQIDVFVDGSIASDDDQVFDDELIGNPGQTKGVVTFDPALGPASMFAVGIDDCLGNDTGPGTPCSSEDQVLLAGLGFSYDDGNDDNPPPDVVPLPAGLPLLLGALGILGVLQRRRSFAA